MRKRRKSIGRELGLLLAEQGVGPLLRRDYWAVIGNCRVSPAELMRDVRRYFPAFAPRELASFHGMGNRPLEKGDELEVHIAGAGRFHVVVTHVDEQSFTLATEDGHPEAGRITFGSYRNRRGDVIFHIRSHARSSSRKFRAGFLATGEVMQTSTWTDFVNRVAVAYGDGVIGFIQAITSPCEDEPADEARTTPTFMATGG